MQSCLSFPACCPSRRWASVEKMRIVVLVELSQSTRHERKVRRVFLEALFKGGYTELQEGVFTRLAEGRDAAAMHIGRLRTQRPEFGTVRVLCLTEAQFAAGALVSGTETPQEEEIGSELDVFL